MLAWFAPSQLCILSYVQYMRHSQSFDLILTLLSAVTKAMLKNLADYAEEERMKEIEEREGYSE